MIKEVTTREELRKLVRAGRGYVYNDFGGKEEAECPIHPSDCRHIAAMLDVKPGRLTVRKVWSDDLAELIGWIRGAGKVHSRCDGLR